MKCIFNESSFCYFTKQNIYLAKDASFSMFYCSKVDRSDLLNKTKEYIEKRDVYLYNPLYYTIYHKKTYNRLNKIYLILNVKVQK